VVVICPMTTTDRDLPSHVRIDPDEGGVTESSFVKTEDVRAISTTRLIGPRGFVEASTMKEVAKRLRILLGL
jgi:mRNA interferase MazF